MTDAVTNRWLEALGGADSAEAAAQLHAHPGVALFFGLMLFIGLGAAVAVLAWMIMHRPRTRLLLDRPWYGRDAVRLTVVLLALLGFYLTGLGIVRSSRPDLADSDVFVAGAAALQSVAFHWPVLIFVIVTLIRRRTTVADAFGMEGAHAPGHAVLGALLYPAVLPAVAAAAFLARLLLQGLGMDAEPQEVLQLMIDRGAGPLRFYLIALGVCIAPIAEEILFRGLMLPVLARHIGVAGGLVASAAVFAALHMNAAAAAPLFVLGLAFGLAYLYTGSLTVSIVLHAVFNAVSIAVSSALQTT